MPRYNARILLADDHQEFLNSMARFLTADFEVVGTAEDGYSLLEAAAIMKPDIVILDISMPHLSGIEATRRMRERGSQARVIILTAHDDPDFINACFEAGALGYVCKSRVFDLPAAIEAALEDRQFMSSSPQAKADVGLSNTETFSTVTNV